MTDADLDYVGSITIDQNILEAAGLRPGQMVQITNVSNAVLWRTYILAGKAGRGDIVLNGPPARLFKKGDKVIILGEAYLEPSEVKDSHPTVVFVDEKNKIIRVEESAWKKS